MIPIESHEGHVGENLVRPKLVNNTKPLEF